MEKIKSITLQNEIDPKTGLVLIKDYNSYNSIKFYLQKDEETPNIKYVIEQFKEQKKFNEQQLKFNQQQMEFNKSFSDHLDSIDNRLTSVENRLDSVEKRLDSVENRLTRLESFHKNDVR